MIRKKYYYHEKSRKSDIIFSVRRVEWCFPKPLKLKFWKEFALRFYTHQVSYFRKITRGHYEGISVDDIFGSQDEDRRLEMLKACL